MHKPTRAVIVLTIGLVGLVGRTPMLSQARDQGSDASFLLVRGRAGQLELGMTVNAVYTRIGGRNIQLVAAFGEGHFSPVLEIRLVGYTPGPAFTAIIATGPCGNDYSILGVEVHDPRFRTRNGLGVGSTLSDLQRLYPGSEVRNITFRMERLPAYTKASRVVSVSV
jgi:hypothetical protein